VGRLPAGCADGHSGLELVSCIKTLTRRDGWRYNEDSRS
jgi:hypothetical protein